MIINAFEMAQKQFDRVAELLALESIPPVEGVLVVPFERFDSPVDRPGKSALIKIIIDDIENIYFQTYWLPPYSSSEGNWPVAIAILQGTAVSLDPEKPRRFTSVMVLRVHDELNSSLKTRPPPCRKIVQNQSGRFCNETIF